MSGKGDSGELRSAPSIPSANLTGAILAKCSGVRKILPHILSAFLIADAAFGDVSPQIRSVAPAPVTGTSYPQLFTIYGTNFDRKARILLRDFRTGESFNITNFEFRSESEIAIRPIFTHTPAKWSVAVVSSNGQTSQPFQFDVRAPAMTPQISRVHPSRMPALNTRQHFTISGENFVSGCTVRLRDKRTGEKFDIRPNKLINVHQITIEANVSAKPALWSVQVINPGGEESGEHPFHVMSPKMIHWMQLIENWRFSLGLIFLLSAFLWVSLLWIRRRLRNQNVHALQDAEDQWKERLNFALAEQRREFRKDLHDSISYDVARISLLCQEALAAGQANALPERIRATVSSLNIAARDMENDLGDVLWLGEFHDGSLNRLLGRLRQRIRDFLSESGVRVEFKTPPPGPDQSISLAVAKNLLLVVNEILNNILKHSGATQVTAKIRREASSLTICIEDNGRGFDLDTSFGGQGLQNIRTRMEAELHGRVEITSTSDGTAVRLILPLSGDTKLPDGFMPSDEKAKLCRERPIEDSASPSTGDRRSPDESAVSHL